MSKKSKLFLIIYLSAVLLYVTALILSESQIYIRGYRSTSFLFVVMSSLGLLFILVLQRDFKTSFGLGLLYSFVILSFILSFLLLLEIISDYNKQLIYNDKKYRLEDTRRGFMEPCRLPKLFIKNGIFERGYNLNTEPETCIDISDIEKVNIIQLLPGNISVTIHHTSRASRQIPNPLIITVDL